MAWVLRSPRPPRRSRPYTSDEYLWWGVLRQAAKDLDKGSRSEAIDAYEFLEITGKWLTQTLFDVSPERYDRELRARVSRRFAGASIFSRLR